MCEGDTISPIICFSEQFVIIVVTPCLLSRNTGKYLRSGAIFHSASASWNMAPERRYFQGVTSSIKDKCLVICLKL